MAQTQEGAQERKEKYRGNLKRFHPVINVLGPVINLLGLRPFDRMFTYEI